MADDIAWDGQPIERMSDSDRALVDAMTERSDALAEPLE